MNTVSDVSKASGASEIAGALQYSGKGMNVYHTPIFVYALFPVDEILSSEAKAIIDVRIQGNRDRKLAQGCTTAAFDKNLCGRAHLI